MFSLVFSFQWNVALNSLIMRTYYIFELGNNFHPTHFASRKQRAVFKFLFRTQPVIKREY